MSNKDGSSGSVSVARESLSQPPPSPQLRPACTPPAASAPPLLMPALVQQQQADTAADSVAVPAPSDGKGLRTTPSRRSPQRPSESHARTRSRSRGRSSPVECDVQQSGQAVALVKLAVDAALLLFLIAATVSIVWHTKPWLAFTADTERSALEWPYDIVLRDGTVLQTVFTLDIDNTDDMQRAALQEYIGHGIAALASGVCSGSHVAHACVASLLESSTEAFHDYSFVHATPPYVLVEGRKTALVRRGHGGGGGGEQQ